MIFLKSWQDSEATDWIYQYDVSQEEMKALHDVEIKANMSLQDMTTSWLKWLINNPEEGKKLLLKWKEDQNI